MGYTSRVRDYLSRRGNSIALFEVCIPRILSLFSILLRTYLLAAGQPLAYSGALIYPIFSSMYINPLNHANLAESKQPTRDIILHDHMFMSLLERVSRG